MIACMIQINQRLQPVCSLISTSEESVIALQHWDMSSKGENNRKDDPWCFSVLDQNACSSCKDERGLQEK